jgi:hypothetical protein
MKLRFEMDNGAFAPILARCPLLTFAPEWRPQYSQLLFSLPLVEADASLLLVSDT